ncbi:MAG: Gfo/Idh/MocA family oxidoreductase [Candidatus Omnitrophica bacterium]|nr:Gfo/Idh/MocA family oxidoreductase [Candidatus Omnitrophota bacterium]
MIMGQREKYRAAIIGCGRIAGDFDDDPLMRQNYGISTHAGAYADNPGIDLIAAADLSPDKLDKFGRRWGVSRLYKDHKELLAKENIDVLSICAWNTTHLEILEEAAKRGVKVIFCEKPISDSLINADKMVHIANHNNIALFVNHRRRWDDLYIKLKGYIKQGHLGNIGQVSCYYNAGIANTGCHMFDALRMLFGDAKTVTAWYKGGPDQKDPDMDGYMIFENNISVCVQSMDIKDYLVFEFDIYGSKGRIRIENNGFNLSHWRPVESRRYKGLNELMPAQAPIVFSRPAMFKNAVNNIIDCLNTKAQPVCSGDDGVKALEIISAFHLSAQAGNKTVGLPLKDRTYTIESK